MFVFVTNATDVLSQDFILTNSHTSVPPGSHPENVKPYQLEVPYVKLRCVSGGLLKLVWLSSELPLPFPFIAGFRTLKGLACSWQKPPSL